MAGDFLIKQGYTVLDYNYRCFFGEIDIVAKDKDTIVFCEVKYRSSLDKGNPFEAVDYRKQQIIYKCAMAYLAQVYKGDKPSRFDIIGCTDNKEDGVSFIHLKNAFWG